MAKGSAWHCKSATQGDPSPIVSGSLLVQCLLLLVAAAKQNGGERMRKGGTSSAWTDARGHGSALVPGVRHHSLGLRRLARAKVLQIRGGHVGRYSTDTAQGLTRQHSLGSFVPLAYHESRRSLLIQSQHSAFLIRHVTSVDGTDGVKAVYSKGPDPPCQFTSALPPNTITFVCANLRTYSLPLPT